MSRAARGIRAFVLILLIATPILLAGAIAAFWFLPDRPYGDSDDGSVEFIVPNGAYILGVATDLESTGLVADGRYVYWRYKILSRAGLIAPIQAGRYQLARGQRPSDILNALTSQAGIHRVYTSLTIPPGLSAARMADRVESTGLASAEDVMEAILALAPNYPVMENPEGLQGYLFPDTYKVETPLVQDESTSNATARTIVRTMADQFFSVLDDVDPSWKSLTKYQLHEKITLASIIEREYRREEEAPLISAVFHNRLNEGMRLESCATVVYVIEDTPAGRPFQAEYQQFDRRIFLRYLDIQSPFNTYRNEGLPPGPISLPGRVALEAAFFPAESDALFFVVKDPIAGTHVFTRDYADHLNARESYLNQYVVKD